MGSFAVPEKLRNFDLLESTCGYLVQELKLIWDEVGQDQTEREKVILELKQECHEIFKRKVDEANISRAHLHQLLADQEAQYTQLLVSLGERPLPGRPEKTMGTLREKLDSITPALRKMQLRKDERVDQFIHVQMQVQKISAEISAQTDIEVSASDIKVNENDLSLKKLGEYQLELERLTKEKNDRLLKIEGYKQAIHNLAGILGMDSSEIIANVHPSLEGRHGHKLKNIGNDILAGLDNSLESLKKEKQNRLEKIRKLGDTLINLWNLMDTSYKDRLMFSHITDLQSVSAAEIPNPGSLSINIIHQADAEVEKLDRLKAGKMQELFFKKQLELEEICKSTHMQMPPKSETDYTLKVINSKEISHVDLLMMMDEQISRAKEEASTRNAIMEKVQRWMLLRDEERWLEEYNMDENRYSMSRGAHKNLKRAERARIAVNKIPALVASLREKTESWEEERKKVFVYDEVPLLEILDDYVMLRQDKEEEKQRQREKKKKMQVQVAVGQENLSASRPPMSNRRLSIIGVNGEFGCTTPSNRRLSMGIHQLESNSMNSSKGMPFRKEIRSRRI